ncbi:MAG: hypothetical protein JW720_07510, partial [Sedimentisphaerales bacterium]|nr:hypothetical protein [Sedimentisphaerales bacterium]
MSARLMCLAACALLLGQLAGAADAADPNLVAWFEFEGDLTDSSGHGNEGTAVGTVTFPIDSERGRVAQLGSGYVEVGAVGISGSQPRTIAGWAKADTMSMPEWTNVFGFTGPAGCGKMFDIEIVGETDYTTSGWYGVHCFCFERDILEADLEWHHLAASYAGDGTSQVIKWYGDGELKGVATAWADPTDNVHIGKRGDQEDLFSGRVDDVRI